jgi:subtilisin family serine protease
VRRLPLSIFVTVLAVASVLACPALADPFPDHPRVPGELIVGFHESTSPAAEQALHERIGATVVRHAPASPMTLVRFEPGVPLEQREAAYLADPAVAFVERNYLGEGGFTPNDTYFADQWQHANTGQFGGTPGADIESEAGWDLVQGGSSIVVAVLDSGIDSDHPEFAGRIVAGWDFVNSDADPEDDLGHGTAVTGLLAANADNAFAVAGVDPSCLIMPIKVINQFNSGTIFDLIAGVDFAALNNADVLSMSLINYPLTTGLNQSLGAAKQTGAILVACAGNGGIGDADVSAPGNSTHTISIGATDFNDARASYSGTGTKLDYVAPGDNVVTVAYNTALDTTWFFNGCSSATPVAAGIVSLLKSLEPTLVSSEVRSFLTAGAEDLVGILAEDTAGWDQYMGNGRVNLRATIQAYLDVVAASDVAAAARGLEVEVRPNPARGLATVSFTMPVPDWVTVAIFDVGGRRVRTLAHGVRPTGEHKLRWDGLDGERQPAAPGIYFVRVTTRRAAETEKLVLAR